MSAPIAWNAIRGQDQALERFQRALETDSLHHGYLVSGPRGVGKWTTIRTVVATLNCSERPDHAFQPACMSCYHCRKIFEEQHPDLQVIRPSGNVVRTIKIDDVRQIQKATHHKPWEARFQVIVVDEAELMTVEAANALLKTLEEPPEHVKLFLITSQPGRLLDTIRSRCQHVRFSRLPVAVVQEMLRQAYPGDVDYELVSAWSEGSAGRAFEIVESGLLEERDQIVRLFEVEVQDRVSELMDIAQEWSRAEREEFGRRLEMMLIVVRDLQVLQATGRDDHLRNRDFSHRLQAIAQRQTWTSLQARAHTLKEAIGLSHTTANRQMLAESVLLSMGLGA